MAEVSPADPVGVGAGGGGIELVLPATTDATAEQVMPPGTRPSAARPGCCLRRGDQRVTRIDCSPGRGLVSQAAASGRPQLPKRVPSKGAAGSPPCDT